MLTHIQGTQQCSLHINKVLSNVHSTSTRYSAMLTPHQQGTQQCSLHINKVFSTTHSTAFCIQDNSYLVQWHRNHSGCSCFGRYTF